MASADTSLYSDTWSESGTSPSVSPPGGLAAISNLGRRVSAGSSATSQSALSNNGSSFDSVVGKRRGFSRPNGTAFASSARNRDSVMSLGTISHLQHYFARTGLLDGKGAQLAKDDPFKKEPGSRTVSGSSQTVTSDPTSIDTSFFSNLSPIDVGPAGSTNGDDFSFVTSPDQTSFDGGWDEPNSLVLPPTVSTYKHKSTYVPPPPSMTVLRRELREALEDAKKLLRDVQSEQSERTNASKTDENNSTSPPRQDNMQGWHEIQGLQVLDLTTLAIRAAKNFYTAHERTHRLYSVQSERQIRADLFNVMEILKKLAARSFAGGIKQAEINEILTWASGIEELVRKDEEAEKVEHEQLQRSQWQSGDWTGRERERNVLFLRSFDSEPATLPEWTAPDDELPTPFLAALRDGRRLVKLHNELVRKSRRHFEEIKKYHLDVDKPYRCAENLRYWVKAAELRWDCFLRVDVHGIVHNSSPNAWRLFDEALMTWCRTVREELSCEWQQHHEAMKTERPILRMDPGHDENGISVVPW